MTLSGIIFCGARNGTSYVQGGHSTYDLQPQLQEPAFNPILTELLPRTVHWIEVWRAQKCPRDGPQISRACPDQEPFLRPSCRQLEASRHARGLHGPLALFLLFSLVSHSWCLEDPSLVEGQPSLLLLPHLWPSTL